jgi:two-component system response regulator HydG
VFAPRIVRCETTLAGPVGGSINEHAQVGGRLYVGIQPSCRHVEGCDGTPFTVIGDLSRFARGQSWPDARRARPGLFVQAAGGTLLLDEIGDMPAEMQVKLLRVLQERKVRPVGGEDELAFDARIIAATNRDLESDVADKRFREDLYYRVNVVQISLPPLRARPTDLLAIAHALIQRMAARIGKPVTGIAPDAARLMLDYEWPGNVRELENTLERAITLTSFNQLAAVDLPDKIREHRRSILATATGRHDELIPLAEVERRYVRQVLAAVGGNKTMAARILGIDRRSLYRVLEDDDRVAPAAPGSGT